MPNEHGDPTQEERDERIVLPLDPEVDLRALLKVKPSDGDDDELEPDDPTNPPGLRTQAEWNALTDEEVNALGTDT